MIDFSRKEITINKNYAIILKTWGDYVEKRAY